MRKRVLPFFALLLIMTFTGCTQNTGGSDNRISFNVNSSNSENSVNSTSKVK